MSSVLPTPVGPRKMNEPIGRFGSCEARHARGAPRFETASTASAWPMTRLPMVLFHAEQLFALAFEHLVDRNAGPARDDLGDVAGR